jgi:hypothetical protein
LWILIVASPRVPLLCLKKLPLGNYGVDRMRVIGGSSSAQ